MGRIGGNITGIIQTYTKGTKNAIGELDNTWADVFSQIGWLGMQSGGSQYTNYSAKVEESSHVFICDYHAGIYALANQNTRMILKGVVYDVLLIDNPDEMDQQLEIYLKRVGAANGS